MKIAVSFVVQGTLLSGNLYLPDQHDPESRLPGVVVTGAWTTVKEQMPAVYAEALAARGFAVLTFDFRGWGESPDAVSYLEDPQRKTDDIVEAFAFLASRPEVDAGRIAGLGICASSGYMSDAALRSEHARSVALVAPWLHDATIAAQVYGGDEGIATLIAAGRQAAAASTPQYIEAASTTNEAALMYNAPYYTEPKRGLIPEYDNRFNVASWEPWLTYDALKTPVSLSKPTLLVHSEAAAIPQGAKRYAELMGERASVVWLDGATQFDFYDQEDVVTPAADAVAHHFHATMRAPKQQAKLDSLRIRRVVESVALLADAGDFEPLEKLYADEVRIDYTSLFGGEVEVKSPPTLMSQWAAVLPGFDCTKHDVSNIAVTLKGPEAEAACDVRATHLIADKGWTVSGRYEYRLVNTDGDWRITSHKFVLAEEEGTREVLGMAVAAATANPPSYLVRQETLSTVRAFLTSLERKDMDRFAELWADDAVQHMPYAPEGFPSRVAGKSAILDHYAAWPENSGAADFTSELVLYPMSDPEMVFAEFKGDVDIVPTQRKYQQSYGGLFHVRRGKITLFREYFNPGPFVFAFGLDEGGAFHGGKQD